VTGGVVRVDFDFAVNVVVDWGPGPLVWGVGEGLDDIATDAEDNMVDTDDAEECGFDNDRSNSDWTVYDWMEVGEDVSVVFVDGSSWFEDDYPWRGVVNRDRGVVRASVTCAISNGECGVVGAGEEVAVGRTLLGGGACIAEMPEVGVRWCTAEGCSLERDRVVSVVVVRSVGFGAEWSASEGV